MVHLTHSSFAGSATRGASGSESRVPAELHPWFYRALERRLAVAAVGLDEATMIDALCLVLESGLAPSSGQRCRMVLSGLDGSLNGVGQWHRPINRVRGLARSGVRAGRRQLR